MISDYKKLLVCIVGYGSIGRRHARNLKKLGVRVIVFRTGLAHEDNPGFDKTLEFYYDFDAVIDLHPDAIVICNPTSLHADFAKKAIDNHIDFFTEKPISHELEGLDIMVSKIKDTGLVSSVGYMMRYDPCLLTLKDMVFKKVIGNISSAIMEWGTYLPSWHDWEDYSTGYAAQKRLGGGLVLTCSHEIDMTRFLFGEVTRIEAYGGKASALDLEVEDHVDILSKHESGITSHLHIDWFQKIGRRYVHVIGDLGRLEWDFFKNNLILYDFNSQESCVITNGKEINFLYNENIRDFLDSVLDRSKTRCDFEDGFKTLIICDTILKKIEENY